MATGRCLHAICVCPQIVRERQIRRRHACGVRGANAIDRLIRAIRFHGRMISALRRWSLGDVPAFLHHKCAALLR